MRGKPAQMVTSLAVATVPTARAPGLSQSVDISQLRVPAVKRPVAGEEKRMLGRGRGTFLYLKQKCPFLADLGSTERTSRLVLMGHHSAKLNEALFLLS